MLLGIYLVGVVATAAVLFRTRVFKRDCLSDAGLILLWPVYWGFCAVAQVLGRRR